MKFSIGLWLCAALFSGPAFADTFTIDFTATSGIAPIDTQITFTPGPYQFDFQWDGLTFTTNIDAFFNHDFSPGMGAYTIFSNVQAGTGTVAFEFHNYPENTASAASTQYIQPSGPPIHPVGEFEGTFITHAVPESGSIDELLTVMAAVGLMVAANKLVRPALE
jgi:hypothetical protein